MQNCIYPYNSIAYLYPNLSKYCSVWKLKIFFQQFQSCCLSLSVLLSSGIDQVFNLFVKKPTGLNADADSSLIWHKQGIAKWCLCMLLLFAAYVCTVDEVFSSFFSALTIYFFFWIFTVQAKKSMYVWTVRALKLF